MSEPDEIDRIIARAVALECYGGYPVENKAWGEWDTSARCERAAATVRATLLRAGYRIELDPNALLSKGVDAVRGGSVHD